MAYTIYRFFRFLSSIFVPMTAVIGFSCLLTFIFILYQPTIGPGASTKMGWQSWEVVNLPLGAGTSQKPVPPGGHLDDTKVDWWNATSTAETNVDMASFPLDVWAPLMPHDTGLSEISISSCIFDPIYVDFCKPKSTADDAIRGKWVMVDRNLNYQGRTYLNIYYRRTRRQDVELITELRLLPQGQTPPGGGNWVQVSHDLRDGGGGAPLYLWYKLGSTWSEMTPEQRQKDLITEMDVVFGADVPWYGFEKLTPPTTIETPKVQEVSITFRRGVKPPPRAPPLHFSHSGKFKILQVADLHFSVSRGMCRDSPINPCANSDNSTTNLIGRVLDAEKPDLVVFTGDQLNGQGTSWDTRSVLAKFARAVTDRGIAWSVVFGNHDEDDGGRKDEMVKMIKALPYSMVEAGPKDIHGVGNYVLKVKSPDPSKTHLLTLYFLDSGSYAAGYFDWFGFVVPTEYDYLRQSQIDWFLQESAQIKPIERPFSPDGAKDLGGLWSRQQHIPETKRLAKPNALMFFHMPMQEAYDPADIDPQTGKALDVGITGQEDRGSAKKSEQFFENGLLKALESEHVARAEAKEVKVVANGHCHLTENCRRVRGIWNCFGGGGSYSAYGKIGFDRRFRVYDVKDYGETISTYKRTEHDEILDEMVLAGRGAPPLL